MIRYDAMRSNMIRYDAIIVFVGIFASDKKETGFFKMFSYLNFLQSAA